ncbi:putative 6-oxopurine nucleoside phosphorylase [uncultured archaeon]|nr:putative 6-oxopurine nucleoside phosphorylase [uncultured archaeon]
MAAERKIAIIAGSAGNLIEGKAQTHICCRRLVKAVDGTVDGKPVIFLPRHGLHHTIPPHKVKYKANMSLLVEKFGATDILSISAVGSNQVKYPVGSFVLASDFIGFAHDGRTLFDKFKEKPMHAPMGEPYSLSLNGEIVSAGNMAGIKILTGAVLLDVPGPRFETHAEIGIFRQWGADLMGMTSVGETMLANEFRLAGYAIRNSTLCMVTDFTPGTNGSKGTVHEEVKDVLKEMQGPLNAIIRNFVKLVS